MAGDDSPPTGRAGRAGESETELPETVRRYRRVPVLLAVAILPWTVVAIRDTVSLFFVFGIVNADPVHLTTVTDYYFRFTGALPRYLLAYGVSGLLFGAAVVSALVGLYWRESGRVTAGLLVVAGLSQLWFAAGFYRRPGYVAVPLGTVAVWLVAWWYYRPELRQLVGLAD